MKKRAKSDSLAQRVKLLIRSVAIIVVLYLCSIVISIALVALMGYLLWLNNKDGYAKYSNMPLIALFFGSIYLCCKILTSFTKIRPTQRKDLVPISRESNPELFAIIEEVAAYMKIPPPRNIFISSSASASIYVDSSIMTLFSHHHKSKSLEIGLGLINTMNYDELRAIIAHEMAHYSQQSTQLGTPVYILGKSAKRLKESARYQRNWYEGMYYGLSDIFGLVIASVFNRVLKSYRNLSDELEYDADRIAAEYVGSATLISALYKASFTQHQFNTLMQSIATLAEAGRVVENIYAAQRAINGVSFGHEWSYKLADAPLPNDKLSRIVKERVERLQNGAYETQLPTNHNPAREMLLGYEAQSVQMTHFIYKELYKMEIEKGELLSIPIYTLWIDQMLSDMEEFKAQQKESAVKVVIKMKGWLHFAPIIESRFKIYWDGKFVGKGGYKKDFSHSLTAPMGAHKLKLVGFNIKPDEFIVEVPSGRGEVVLDLDYKVHDLKSEYRFFIKK